MRGATLIELCIAIAEGISTHTPHAGRDKWHMEHAVLTAISTHTPHAGRDRLAFATQALLENFYSHAPCGARRELVANLRLHYAFLLTRPMRGATRGTLTACRQDGVISTHTPHAGRDVCIQHQSCAQSNFYSHAPCGARPRSPSAICISSVISTHTPHAGRDLLLPEARCSGIYFYSHAPCGARRKSLVRLPGDRKFLLTRPMRGATITIAGGEKIKVISTHTPHAGRDRHCRKHLG